MLLNYASNNLYLSLFKKKKKKKRLTSFIIPKIMIVTDMFDQVKSCSKHVRSHMSFWGQFVPLKQGLTGRQVASCHWRLGKWILKFEIQWGIYWLISSFIIAKQKIYFKENLTKILIHINQLSPQIQSFKSEKFTRICTNDLRKTAKSEADYSVLAKEKNNIIKRQKETEKAEALLPLKAWSKMGSWTQ